MGAEVSLGAQAGAVVVSGLLTVFLALVILIGVVWLMGKVLHREKPKAPPASGGNSAPKAAAPAVQAAPAPAPVQAPPAQAQSGVEEETVAVITAAIQAMMDAEGVQTPFRVASVQPAGSSAGRPAWGMAGLMQNTSPL